MALIHWWPFNGSLKNRMEASSLSVSGPVYREGKVSQHCWYSTSAVATPITIQDLDPLNKSFSFSCWVKINKAEVAAQISKLATNATNNRPTGSLIGYNEYGGVALTWYTYSGVNYEKVYLMGTIRETEDKGGTWSYELPYDTWTHAVLVNNAKTRQLRLYINGVTDNNKPYDTSIINFVGRDTSSVCINVPSIYAGNGPKSILPCCLNDVRIYDHALTTKEIQLLSQGLVAHYPLKAPYLPNLLQGAEEYTKGNPLVRNVTDTTVLTDSYLYHNNITAEIKRPGKYLFVLSTDGSPSSHIVNKPEGTVENKKYSIWLQLTSSAEHEIKYRIWDGGHIAKDGRHYGIIEIKAAGTYNVRTNLYLYQGLGGNYTVNFWDMQLFECDKYIPYKFEPLHEDRLRSKYINQILKIDECFCQDASGYGNRMRSVGDIVISEAGSPYFSSACFNNSGYLYNNSFNLTMEQFSFSFWVNPPKSTKSQHFLFGTFNSWPNNGVGVWRDADSGGDNSASYSFLISQGTNTYKGANATLTANTWSHVVLTYDGQYGKVFINGTEATSFSFNNNGSVRHPVLYLGTSLYASGSNTLETEIDEACLSDFRFYASVLSDDEIGALGSQRTTFENKATTVCEFVEINNKDAFQSNGSIASNFSEIDAPLSNMKIKALPDGSTWARIHHLDMTDGIVNFTDDEVQDCDVPGKYSKMGLVDSFKYSMPGQSAPTNYEFMLTYPSIEKGLPEGYIQLEYIESNGQQCIDTEVIGGARWEFDIQFKVNGIRQLMGYGGSSNEYWGIQQDGNYGLAKNASWGTIVVPDAYGGKRDIVIHRYNDQGKYSLRAKDTEIGLAANVDVTNRKYTLFALTPELGSACYAKLYDCNCIQNGKLTRKFVPARRILDGINGLYDLVEGKFYINCAGNSENFIAGPEIETYTKLEFIASDGSQYINTDFVPNQNTKIECCFSATSMQNNESYVYGAGVAHNSRAFELYPWNNTFQTNYGTDAVHTSTVLLGQKVTTIRDKTTFSINGTIQSKVSSNSQTFTCPCSLYLFAINRDGKTELPLKGIKMYYCKIYDDNTLIRDYVPVIASSGRVGMLDVLNNRFYPSKTNNFIAGPLPGDIWRLSYIEATGEQAINTGVQPSADLITEVVFTAASDGINNNVVFGAGMNAQGYILRLNNTSDLGDNIWFVGGGVSKSIKMNSPKDRLSIRVANNYISVNGVKTIYNRNKEDLQSDIWIMDCLDRRGVVKRGKGKIESVRMWKGGVLIRDLVPAKDTLTERVGMYDLVQNMFYGDMNDGDFIAGEWNNKPAPSHTIEQYNRWLQKASPNTSYGRINSYTPIHTDFTRWDGYAYDSGPISKSFNQGKATYLVNNSNDIWAPIGQKVPYGDGICAANGTTQHETELWVRFDKMPEATEIKIRNDGSISAPDFIEY